MRKHIGATLAILSALLLFIAGEPLHAGLLGWVALVPLLVAILRADRVLHAWLFGLAFALSYFAVELAWIFIFGWMAWTALVVTLAVYTSVAAVVAGIVRRTAIAPLLVAGAFAGVELAKDRWPFGGFPWGAVGTTQTSVPGVRFLAGTIGVYGLTFLCVFVAACLAHYLVLRKAPTASIVAVLSVLLALVAVDLVMDRNTPPGKPITMAVVQGGVPRPPRPDQRDTILENHIRTTRSLLDQRRVDIVLWPEDSIGIGVSPGAIDKVQSLARHYRTPFLVGHSVDNGPRERFLNLVQHIDRSGRIVETYQKRHPVPFGEYVPIKFFRRFVSTLSEEVPYDQVPGDRANVFDVAGTKIATPICFESVFPRDFLDFERNGARVFVLSTNNASFEHSYAARQHLAHTRMRALELRQWVIQDALAGISAVVAPDGSQTHTTKLFERTGFVTTVRARPSPSLYAHIGDVFPEAWAALAGAAALWTLALRRRLVGSKT